MTSNIWLSLSDFHDRYLVFSIGISIFDQLLYLQFVFLKRFKRIMQLQKIFDPIVNYDLMFLFVI